MFRAFLLSTGLLSLASAGKISSSVKVHLPKDLNRSGGYDHREALFGVPPYGGSIQQNVIYADSQNLCSPVTNKHWKAPFILMVDRGDCTFVQKVRNAQHAGAAAVIIADNACQCKHEKVCTPDPNTMCEKREPIMADDGSGDDITIPSVLLFKTDADEIKKIIVRGKTVRMELAWSVPNPDAHVEWDLWTSPTDFASAQFKENFRAAALALGERATLTPHMYIYDGLAAKCRNSSGESECFNLCTNNGRYCATDPDGDLEYGISGADVVSESIRRLCIWELYGDDGVGVKWWDYIKEFSDKCDNEENFMKDDCVKNAMAVTDIEYDSVEQCIFNHGGLENGDANDLLDQQLDEKESKGIVIMPVVYVNGVAVRGRLEFDTIFKAICAGYADGSKPDICNKCSECADELKCVQNGKCPAVEGTVEIKTFMASIVSVLVIMTAIGVFVYMRQHKLMKAQVRGILKEYMPLDINNKNGSTALEQDDDDSGSGGIMS